MVNKLQAGALMRRNRLDRRAVSRVHSEDVIVYASEGCGLLDSLLDARFGAEVHPLAAALLNRADLIQEAQHGLPPSIPAAMDALAAYISTKG